MVVRIEPIPKNDTPDLGEEKPIQVIKATLKPHLQKISAKPFEHQI
jgi:hypothetical protein